MTEHLQTAPPLTNADSRAFLAEAMTTCGLEVLVLDDDRLDLARVRKMTRSINLPVEVTATRTLAEFATALDRQSYDVAIVDYNLVDGTGLEALNRLKNHPVNGSAAVLMLSGEHDTDVVVSAIRMGCHDFIVKEKLSAGRLRESILEALHETFEERDVELEAKLKEAAQRVLEGVTDACLDELRPVLSRMFRQVKILRSVQRDDEQSYRESLERLDDCCLRLWRFANELEGYTDSWQPRPN